MKKEFGLALLRIGMGALMLPHGFDKLSLLLSREEITFPAILGMNPTFSLFLAVIAEVVCAFMLMIGFKTKLVSIPLIMTMLVAIFYVHLGNWGDMELASLYLIGYLTVFFNGSGKYSVDTVWEKFKAEQAKLQLVDY
ncbi:MAG: DoxX family protein [Flammeovirgaceae bacterium]